MDIALLVKLAIKATDDNNMYKGLLQNSANEKMR